MGASFDAVSSRCQDCEQCPLSSGCFPGALDGESLRELENVIQHSGPVHAGTTLYHQGESFKYIAVVRTGTVKTFAFDRNGREHTIGFHLTGDFIGLSAIDEGRYPSTAVALDTVSLCKLPFHVTAELAAKSPVLQAKLFRLMSRDIARATRMTCNTTAEERLAAFLIGMGDAMSARGYSSNRWQLTMSRMDIANFLRLTPETLSRLLRRFQADGLMSIEGREVEVRQRERLQMIACAQAIEAPSRHQVREDAA